MLGSYLRGICFLTCFHRSSVGFGLRGAGVPPFMPWAMCGYGGRPAPMWADTSDHRVPLRLHPCWEGMGRVVGPVLP